MKYNRPFSQAGLKLYVWVVFSGSGIDDKVVRIFVEGFFSLSCSDFFNLLFIKDNKVLSTWLCLLNVPNCIHLTPPLYPLLFLSLSSSSIQHFWKFAAWFVFVCLIIMHIQSYLCAWIVSISYSHEYQPHSLREITAWPYVSCIDLVRKWQKHKALQVHFDILNLDITAWNESVSIHITGGPSWIEGPLWTVMDAMLVKAGPIS